MRTREFFQVKMANANTSEDEARRQEVLNILKSLGEKYPIVSEINADDGARIDWITSLNLELSALVHENGVFGEATHKAYDKFRQQTFTGKDSLVVPDKQGSYARVRRPRFEDIRAGEAARKLAYEDLMNREYAR